MPVAQDDRALHTLAKERIGTGELPREVERSILAGPGNESLCDLCNKPVDSPQIEYEVKDFRGRSFRFHIRCHEIWRSTLHNGG
jgi:hypothetical protein